MESLRSCSAPQCRHFRPGGGRGDANVAGAAAVAHGHDRLGLGITGDVMVMVMSFHGFCKRLPEGNVKWLVYG